MKQRVLVSGLLVLCVLKLVWPDMEHYRWQWGEGMGLSTLVVLCGIWACSVWLCDGEATARLWDGAKAWGRAAVKWIDKVACFGFGVAKSLLIWGVAIMIGLAFLIHILNSMIGIPR